MVVAVLVGDLAAIKEQAEAITSIGHGVVENAGSAAWANAAFDVLLRVPALVARLERAEADRDEALAALKDEMKWDMGGVPENEWKARAERLREALLEITRTEHKPTGAETLFNLEQRFHKIAADALWRPGVQSK